MGDITFDVRGWAAWTPGRENEAAWRAWAGAPGVTPTDREPAAPPLLLRRRITPIGQAALRCAWGLPDTMTARLVFASRHGEFSRTLSILDALGAGEDVSPADFTLSVHHALAGLLSIATNNRHGHSAIAAGSESFEFGLMEAIAALTERPDKPVVYLYYDEKLPPPYDVFNEPPDAPLAVALSLGAGSRFSLNATARNGDAAPSVAPALAFLRFLLTDGADTAWPGERLNWRWRRHAAAA